MPNISYLFKRLCTMNYKSMFDRVNIVKKKCNKSKFTIFCDMVWCGICYGAGYVDYDVIGFYKLNSKQRKTMLTRGINNKFVKRLNEREYWHLFNNKNEFNEMFREYLKRDFIYPVNEKKEETSDITKTDIKIIKNFIFDICKCKKNWNMNSFIEYEIKNIKEIVKDKNVILGLSGGVDSSVAAVLIEKAIGKQLKCIFVNTGLLRKNEEKKVIEVFRDNFKIDLIYKDGSKRFLNKLKGITDPEQKRKIIGEEFIRIFEEEAKKIGTVDYLVQGTIYPDVIESGLGAGAKIKSHHNVGGLPDYVDFKEIVEPLRDLFKDEVRKVGLELGLPEFLVYRQPFPGPGLAIRVIGDITEDKLEILKDADFIFREEVAKAGWDRKINQYFAVLTNIKSVGVMGDERTYDYTIALRAVTTSDFMTAEWTKIPYEVLETVSARIVNEVKHVNRVVYDITGKPPATIEWE